MKWGSCCDLTVNFVAGIFRYVVGMGGGNDVNDGNGVDGVWQGVGRVMWCSGAGTA